MSKIQFSHSYNDIISIENLLEAWKEFLVGKKKRKDVQEFEGDLMSNIISLHHDLLNRTYTTSAYEAFKINDPKPRDIHKAKVRDRLLHHALHRKLYPCFDRAFMSDSYSCRSQKGTHRAMNRFQKFFWKESKNNTRTVWVLKCDIRKFFASIDHVILINMLSEYIPDKDVLALFSNIVISFQSTGPGKGLPLGNLTSQLLVNVYMNKFDQFVKHKLKQEFYIRYADDFVIMHHGRDALLDLLTKISFFLEANLKLHLHPDKVSIETVSSGVDFLGWLHFPDHRVLRTTTKKRMFRRLEASEGRPEVVQSYLGLLNHGNAKLLRDRVEKYEWRTCY